jgi:hypothetical protein
MKKVSRGVENFLGSLAQHFRISASPRSMRGQKAKSFASGGRAIHSNGTLAQERAPSRDPRQSACSHPKRLPAAPSAGGILGGNMATNASALDSRVFCDAPSGIEKRLWQAVIVTTIQEWLHGPLRSKRQAEEYLFQDEKDFPVVCQSAGMDSERLRAKLHRLLRQNPALAASADSMNR